MALNALVSFKRLLLNIFYSISPIKKNKIIFNNFCGKGYGCNPKFIAEELLRRSDEYDLVWMVNDPDEVFPKGIRTVPVNSRRAYYELATSKIIVCNVKHALVFKKKKKQFYIQTWHGSFGLKYIEKDAQDKLSKSYLSKTIADSKNINLLLSSSKWQTQEYRRAFWYDGDILEKGFPRNDILFNISKSRIKELKKELGIPLDKKVLLYGPTFRKDFSIDAYDLDLQKIKEALEAKTKEEWVVIVRLHPHVKSYSNLFVGMDFINVTTYPDGQEILAISDVLITDYSSNMIDFILMNRPVFLYASDIEEYKKERGLKPVFFNLPFTLCQNYQELVSAIRDFDMVLYQQKILDFKNQYHSFDDGCASKHVVDIIMEKLQ